MQVWPQGMERKERLDRSILDYHAKEGRPMTKPREYLIKAAHQRSPTLPRNGSTLASAMVSHWLEATMGSMTSVQCGKRFQSTAASGLLNNTFHNWKSVGSIHIAATVP